MAKAKAREQAGLATSIALVPSLSIPTTDTQPRASGSSASMGTSRQAQMGRMVRPSLLREEGSGDRGVL